MESTYLETTQAGGIRTPIDALSDSKGRRWLLSRDFGLVWWSQLISQVGDGVTRLALLWFVYSITGSPLKTTVIGLLQTLPPIVFGPLFGVCVDRLPKKWIMIGSDVLRALLIGVIPCLIAVEQFTIERLYVLVFLTSIASAVFGPAMTAAVPFMVTRAQFTAANALLQTTTSLGVILGPALSGIGIAAMSSQEVLCINALTYLGSAACLLPIRVTTTPAPAAPSSSRMSMAFLRDLLEGAHFALIRQRRILLLILAASLYTFGGAAFSTLYPVFAKKLLDLGPVEVGYLWSAFGAGLLLMSVALVSVSSWELRNRFLLIAGSSAVTGAGLMALLRVHGELAPAMGIMVFIGAGTGTLTPIAWGVVQEITPGHMVGRVLSIYTTAAMTTAIAGMSTFGWVTQTFDERTGVFGIALAMFGTAALAIALTRWVRVRQHRGPVSETATDLRRRATDQL